jgi:hypothetical protein
MPKQAVSTVIFLKRSTSNKKDISQYSCVLIVGDVYSSSLNGFSVFIIIYVFYI